ncbi:HER215Cp [Eremothecium sinecaudum]|uniref:HER215Cp n=1 Tax=Eremothecium sinecaudum TaxID=45286 RepID=A0A109UZK1_9SACH|nr:HER215Cp [Eremothecium sinecaudum]AMD21493.1 HER215Cp [Eremothecium sinecaudum]
MIGACRHGDKCSKRHTRPINSYTIIIYNMYVQPENIKSEYDLIDDFNCFYEDVFMEAAKYGEVQEIIVCENKTDHLNGNVCIRFKDIDAAKAARDAFITRWYGERPLYCDLSHVTEFRDAVCKSYEEGQCERGEKCNFIHRRKVDYRLTNDLLLSQWKKYHIKDPDQTTADTTTNAGSKPQAIAVNNPNDNT